METPALYHWHWKYFNAVYRVRISGGDGFPEAWGPELCAVLESITGQQLRPTGGKIVWDYHSWKQAKKNEVLQEFLRQYREYWRRKDSEEEKKLWGQYGETIRKHSPGTPLDFPEDLPPPNPEKLAMLGLRPCRGKICKEYGELGCMTLHFSGCGKPYKRGPDGDRDLCNVCSENPPTEENFEPYDESDVSSVSSDVSSDSSSDDTSDNTDASWDKEFCEALGVVSTSSKVFV